MENKNTMFGNEVSKKVVARDVRIREQAADFLTQYDKKTKALTEDAEQAKLDAAMSSARFGYASTAKRSADRVRMMNETIAYENNAATYGMTEMVAQVVESGLLLDESELSKILPTYKEDIRDTVAGLLKEGKINSEITNPDTLMLMEYVAKSLPGVKEGRTLTEDDIASIVNKNKTLNIDMAIKNLGSNVESRVSGLLEKEQKQKKDIEKEVEAAKGNVDKNNNGQDDLAEIEEAIMNGDLTQADVDELLSSGEISQKDYDQLSAVLAEVEENGLQGQDEEVPPEGDPAAMGGDVPQDDPNAMAEDPAMAGGEVPPEGDPAAMDAGMAPQDPNAGADPAMAGGMPAQAGVAPGMPKKQVQMLPDGTLNVNIYEEYLAEAADSALVKQSQMANGWSMTKQGRYDPEMLTAKGLGAVKSTLGLGLATLVIGSIPASIRQNNNLERLNSDQYKELRDYCHKDPKCAAIIKKIKAELIEDHPSGKVLKGLKKEFFAALKEAKAKYKESKLTESMDYLLTEMALEEREAVDAGNNLIRETPCTGLFESLAVNEARNMLKEGKEYDSDLCLAKAIMYVTITEAMNELGLIDVTENDYNRIITEAGGCCGNPKNKQKVVKALSKKSVKVPSKKEKGVIVKESAQLNEFCITSGPIMNRYTSDDMAERIRRRKLERLSEGSSGIINE